MGSDPMGSDPMGGPRSDAPIRVSYRWRILAHFSLNRKPGSVSSV